MMTYKVFRDILDMRIEGLAWHQIARSYGSDHPQTLERQFEALVDAQQVWYEVRGAVRDPAFAERTRDVTFYQRDQVLEKHFPQLTWPKLVCAKHFYELMLADAEDLNSKGAPNPTSFGTVWTDALRDDYNKVRRCLNLPAK